MATPAKVLSMIAVDASIKETKEIKVDEPCLAIFANETVFNTKYCMLQEGSNFLPHYGGTTECKFYTVKDVEKALKTVQPMMIHDVPTP